MTNLYSADYDYHVYLWVIVFLFGQSRQTVSCTEHAL